MCNVMTHTPSWEFPSEKNESDEVINVRMYIPHTFSTNDLSSLLS